MNSKELAKARAQRKALLFIWAMIALAGLAITLWGEYQKEEARESANWPSVTGQIITSFVESSTDQDGDRYYSAEIEYKYSVDGNEYTGNTVRIGGHPYSAHDVVRRYPLYKEVSVAHNPVKPSRSVLEPGIISNEKAILGISMIGGSLFMGILFNFILRRATHEETNLSDRILTLLFKTLFFPFTIANGNPLIMAVMVGTAFWIATLEIHPAITWPARVFTAAYGLGLVFMLWGCFLGWLMSLAEKSKQST